jgi:hypothetical protein
MVLRLVLPMVLLMAEQWLVLLLVPRSAAARSASL